MKKKIILFILFAAFNSVQSFSQEYDPYTYQDIEPKPILNEKIFFGGGFGVQFGTSTVLKFTPVIGYRVSPIVELGVGGYYMYAKSRVYNISDHVYGGKIFTRLFVYNDIYLQGEYEMLNIADYDLNTYFYTGERIYISGLLGGIGYWQKLGKRSALLSSISYNFSWIEKTPYRNPVIRFTFVF